MSELIVSLLRLGFLGLLWAAVILAIVVLTRDLRTAQVSTSSIAAAPERARRTKRMPSTLILDAGPRRGLRVPLGENAIVIGRLDDAAVRLDDDYVSNRHARLVLAPTGWLLEDLGSTNGTWIGRQRITTPVPMEIGSTFRIGQNTFRLER